MKNILCLKHVHFERPGIIEKWAIENQYSFNIFEVYNSTQLPDVQNIDMLIVMGGPMSFDDEDKYPWLHNEITYLQNYAKLGKPMLGICLGAQLIVKALGFDARHGSQQEIGWFPLQFNCDVLQDIGINNFPSEITVLHWHGDTFEIPEGAGHIASTEVFNNQGYVYNKNIIGLQFHMEVLPENIDLMLKYCSDDLVNDTWIQTAEQINAGKKYIHETNKLMIELLNYLVKS